MGLGLIASSSLAFVSAGGASTDSTNPKIGAQGFWLNADYSKSIGVAGAGINRGDNLLNVVKNFINFVLWLLGLITLILLLWWGFNMVTAAGDDKKFGDGMKILKNAGIGLAFIALSWMMVSMIFWVIWQIGG